MISVNTQLALTAELYNRAFVLVREDRQPGRAYELAEAARKISHAQYATLTTGEVYEVVRCNACSPRERTAIFLAAIRGNRATAPHCANQAPSAA